MANCIDSKSEFVEILKKAKESHKDSIKIIAENKRYLAKMYDDLFSACDNVIRETNKNLQVMEKISVSRGDPSGTSEVLEALKSSFNLPSHNFLEEMMIAKQKRLTNAQQVNHHTKL